MSLGTRTQAVKLRQKTTPENARLSRCVEGCVCAPRLSSVVRRLSTQDRGQCPCLPWASDWSPKAGPSLARDCPQRHYLVSTQALCPRLAATLQRAPSAVPVRGLMEYAMGWREMGAAQLDTQGRPGTRHKRTQSRMRPAPDPGQTCWRWGFRLMCTESSTFGRCQGAQGLAEGVRRWSYGESHTAEWAHLLEACGFGGTFSPP